jgi:hypothetical protein
MLWLLLLLTMLLIPSLAGLAIWWELAAAARSESGSGLSRE